MSAWFASPAARRLGVGYPIVQGPFGGGLSSSELVATVSHLGGLGSYGDWLRRRCRMPTPRTRSSGVAQIEVRFARADWEDIHSSSDDIN